jgi:hypothetical protein
MRSEACQLCSDSGICSGCHSLTPAKHSFGGFLCFYIQILYFDSQFFREHKLNCIANSTLLKRKYRPLLLNKHLFCGIRCIRRPFIRIMVVDIIESNGVISLYSAISFSARPFQWNSDTV